MNLGNQNSKYSWRIRDLENPQTGTQFANSVLMYKISKIYIRGVNKHFVILYINWEHYNTESLVLIESFVNKNFGWNRFSYFNIVNKDKDYEIKCCVLKKRCTNLLNQFRTLVIYSKADVSELFKSVSKFANHKPCVFVPNNFSPCGKRSCKLSHIPLQTPKDKCDSLKQKVS